MKNSYNRTEKEQVIYLSELEKIIDYKFNDINLLNQALTHKSFAHENIIKDNERLEFLGDAVLQFIISDYLMEYYPNFSEGMLSKFRAVLVSETRLNVIARKIDLGIYLNIGKGEEVTGGRDKSSILADTLEALLAAIYLDSKERAGSREIVRVIIQLFSTEILNAETTFTNIDHKTDLQEYVQKNRLGELKYQIIDEFGPDHQKEFITALLINDQIVGTGRGRSKKISEQNAAIDSLKKMQKK
jgi:ribonuclease-3